MNAKSLLSGLAGGVVYWLAGYLFYVILLGSYFGQNHGAGVKEPYAMWAIVVGCLIFGLLLGVVFERWAGISTVKSGASAGALIGLLYGLSMNFIRFGDSTFFTGLTPGLVDSAVITAMAAFAGAAVGFVLGKMRAD